MLANSPQFPVQDSSKLPFILDSLSCAGALGGTIASAITQQVMFATVPLSVIFAVHVMMRSKQQHILNLSLQAQQQAIHSLGQESSLNSKTIESNFQTQQEAIHSLDLDSSHHSINAFTLERMIENQDQMQQYVTEKLRIDLQHQLDDLGSTVEKLRSIVADSQGGTTISSTEAYYNRGVNQEELGHFEAAIADYCQVIQQEPTHAFAFFRRGLTHARLGQKQAALQDLNTASRHFFGDGDLKNYEIAKAKVKEIHAEERSNVIPIHSMGMETGNPASVNALFGS